MTMTNKGNGSISGTSEQLGLRLKDWREVVLADFPADREITDRTVLITTDESSRFRGSVRISHGRIYTTRQFDAWRNRVMSTPLP